VHCRRIQGGRQCARGSTGRCSTHVKRLSTPTAERSGAPRSAVILRRVTVFYVGQVTETNLVGAYAELERPYQMQEDGRDGAVMILHYIDVDLVDDQHLIAESPHTHCYTAKIREFIIVGQSGGLRVVLNQVRPGSGPWAISLSRR